MQNFKAYSEHLKQESEHTKLILEKYKFDLFLKQYKSGKFPGLRLGQAFHQQFKLERVYSVKDSLDKLYQLDGPQALALIKRIFEFN